MLIIVSGFGQRSASTSSAGGQNVPVQNTGILPTGGQQHMVPGVSGLPTGNVQATVNVGPPAVTTQSGQM